MSTAKVVTILHPSSATNNIVNDSSGNVAIGNNLTVAGTASFTGTLGNITTGTISSGNITSSGTVAATTGTLYPIVSGTAVASTSGTSIDFTSIPSWVKRITVIFNGVSLSGSAVKYIQLGTGGVPTTTGYSTVGGTYYTTNISGATAFTAAFVCNDNSAGSTDSGHAVFTNISGNIWIGSLVMAQPVSTPQIFNAAGTVTLAGVLNMVRITSSNGTDTFDAGSINIMYE